MPSLEGCYLFINAILLKGHLINQFLTDDPDHHWLLKEGLGILNSVMSGGIAQPNLPCQLLPPEIKVRVSVSYRVVGTLCSARGGT